MTDDINKIKKDAWSCYNGYGNKGNCSGSYKNNNKVCFYCLEFIRRIKNPNKREGQDINLKEIFNKVDKDTSNKEIEIPKYEIEKFKFPIDLVEFPLVNGRNPKEVIFEDKVYIIQDLTSAIGKHHYTTRTIRSYTPMDFRTLLATLYFTDYYQNRWITNKFTEWLDLLEVSKKGKYYRDKVIDGLEYLKHTTFYTYYLWDTKKKTRGTDKDKDLTPISVFSPVNEYHLYDDDKRRYRLKVEVGKTFYERIYKQDHFMLLNIKKLLPLSNIATRLFIWVKRHKEDTLFMYPFVFELLRFNIGIKDKNITNARKTFEKVWRDLKDRNLLEGYGYKIWTSKKDNIEYIRFTFIDSLKP